MNGGAAGIIFVNNVPGSLSATIDPVKIDFGTLSKTEGLVLFEKLKAQGPGSTNVTKELVATFSDGPAPFFNPAGGSSSLFSSYGLDNELHIKPVSIQWPGPFLSIRSVTSANAHVPSPLPLFGIV